MNFLDKASSDLDLASTLERIGDDEELLVEILQAFLMDTPTKIQDLKDAVDSGEFSQIMKKAHTLKGSCAAIGATGCRNLALQIEMDSRQEESTRLDDLLIELDVSMSNVKNTIREYLARA